MKTKYLILLLMAAIVGYVPATARDKNEKKDKTEQVAKGKKQEQDQPSSVSTETIVHAVVRLYWHAHVDAVIS